MLSETIEQIKQELETSSNELSRLRSLVNYLEDSKDEVAGAVGALNETHQFYAERTKAISEAITHLERLKDELSKVLTILVESNLEDLLKRIEQKTGQVQGEIQNLNSELKEGIDGLSKDLKGITKEVTASRGIIKDLDESLKEHLNSLTDQMEKDHKVLNAWSETIDTQVKDISKQLGKSQREITSSVESGFSMIADEVEAFEERVRKKIGLNSVLVVIAVILLLANIVLTMYFSNG